MRVDREHESNNGLPQESNSVGVMVARGSLRVALAVSILMLLGIQERSRKDSVTPTPTAVLSSDTVAALCQYREQDNTKGILNPSISRDEEEQIVDMVLDVEGREDLPTHPQALAMTTYGVISPTLSPDQTRVLYNTLDGETVLINRDGSDRVSLVPPPAGSRNLYAEWWNNGSGVVFRRYNEDEESSSLHLVRSDGTKDVQLTHPGAHVIDRNPTSLADGRIAFVRQDSSVIDEDGKGYYMRDTLNIIQADGSGLTEVPVLEYSPYSLASGYEVSPDGQKIAFEAQSDSTHMRHAGEGMYMSEPRVSGGTILEIYELRRGRVFALNGVLPDFGLSWTDDSNFVRFSEVQVAGADQASGLPQIRRFLAGVDGTTVVPCPVKESAPDDNFLQRYI